jgi:hypothetical protein
LTPASFISSSIARWLVLPWPKQAIAIVPGLARAAAARAAAVVDDERLAEHLRQALGECAPDDVARPARRPRNDQPDRLGGIRLGHRESRDREQQCRESASSAVGRHFL